MLSTNYLSYQYLLHALLSRTSLSFEACLYLREKVYYLVQIDGDYSEGGPNIFKKRRLNAVFILDTVSNLKRQFLGPLFTKCLASQEVAFDIVPFLSKKTTHPSS